MCVCRCRNLPPCSLGSIYCSILYRRHWPLCQSHPASTRRVMDPYISVAKAPAKIVVKNMAFLFTIVLFLHVRVVSIGSAALAAWYTLVKAGEDACHDRQYAEGDSRGGRRGLGVSVVFNAWSKGCEVLWRSSSQVEDRQSLPSSDRALARAQASPVDMRTTTD